MYGDQPLVGERRFFRILRARVVGGNRQPVARHYIESCGVEEYISDRPAPPSVALSHLVSLHLPPTLTTLHYTTHHTPRTSISTMNDKPSGPQVSTPTSLRYSLGMPWRAGAATNNRVTTCTKPTTASGIPAHRCLRIGNNKDPVKPADHRRGTTGERAPRLTPELRTQGRG